MWWLRKVRRANISQELRDDLERFGETVIAGALVLGPHSSDDKPLYALVNNHQPESLAWLTERRDIAERKEQRVETVEVAVLIFVVVGVIVDVLLLYHI
jgi:hypothetical protein